MSKNKPHAISEVLTEAGKAFVVKIPAGRTLKISKLNDRHRSVLVADTVSELRETSPIAFRQFLYASRRSASFRRAGGEGRSYDNDSRGDSAQHQRACQNILQFGHLRPWLVVSNHGPCR
jgi:hypothetical protein